MKAANVLITRDGVLKLADFGLARAFSLAKNSQGNRYTNRVVTLWYRPPELLLGKRRPQNTMHECAASCAAGEFKGIYNWLILLAGERDYGPPIDLWGGGCIMAEMWTRSPIMQGNTEQHQLTLISQLCGSITAEVRPHQIEVTITRRHACQLNSELFPLCLRYGPVWISMSSTRKWSCLKARRGKWRTVWKLTSKIRTPWISLISFSSWTQHSA